MNHPRVRVSGDACLSRSAQGDRHMSDRSFEPPYTMRCNGRGYQQREEVLWLFRQEHGEKVTPQRIQRVVEIIVGVSARQIAKTAVECPSSNVHCQADPPRRHM